MKFEIKTNKSINDIMRTIGYTPAYFQNENESEFNIVRKINKNDYPRFHLYIKENGNNFIFNLHLDQKKPSYKSAKSHSGEYNGPLIEFEAERIKSILNVI